MLRMRSSSCSRRSSGLVRGASGTCQRPQPAHSTAQVVDEKRIGFLNESLRKESGMLFDSAAAD